MFYFFCQVVDVSINKRSNLNILRYFNFIRKQGSSQIRKHGKQILRSCMPPVVVTFGFFILCGLVLIVRGRHPQEFYRVLFVSGFASFDDFGYVLFNATPLIFTGLAVAIGYRGGLFNIGCEGQLYVAAFAATWVGLHVAMPSVVLIPLCIGCAVTAGAAWGGIPGFLKAKFGTHEVINTIMMNFIAFALMNYLVTVVYQEPDQMNPQTAPISEAARLPRLAPYFRLLPESNPLNVSFLFACGCVVLCYLFLMHTRWGYELRLVGNAPEVASYGGINPRIVTVWTMAISGATAGLAGVAEVLGYRYRFLDSFSPAWGFTGIAVALLGRNQPFGVLVAAVLFGLLSKVALDIEIFLEVPRGLFLVGQGFLIICLVSIDGFSHKSDFLHSSER